MTSPRGHLRHNGGVTMDTVERERLAERLLRGHRRGLGGLPAKPAAAALADCALRLLFPEAAGHDARADDAATEIERLHGGLLELLEPLRGLRPPMPLSPEETASRVLDALPRIQAALQRDADAICEGDPAAESVEEVILAYPGFLAILHYRLAHELRALGVPLLPRLITECAHDRTGIDIHPGATIGNPLVIDHGTGIVIGETTTIGDNVKLYQGVTLGALSVDKSLASQKRHPTIEDDVVIYANATILGGQTVVGRGSVIGGNVWLTQSVPPDSVVYHRSEVHVRSGPVEPQPIDFTI